MDRVEHHLRRQCDDRQIDRLRHLGDARIAFDAADFLVSRIDGEDLPFVALLEQELHRPAVELVEVLRDADDRSEEHTSELQSLMRISYAVFCLKKKTKTK